MTEKGPPVDLRPSWLKEVQAPDTMPGILDVDGVQYTYTVVKAGLAPGLPYAVGFPSETALMISVDTPEADRPFIMTHEIREKTLFANLPEEARCRAALEAELADVQAQAPKTYPEYVVSRRAFFDALIVFYEQPEQVAAVSPEFTRGIQASREYLHSIAPQVS